MPITTQKKENTQQTISFEFLWVLGLGLIFNFLRFLGLGLVLVFLWGFWIWVKRLDLDLNPSFFSFFLNPVPIQII